MSDDSKFRDVLAQHGIFPPKETAWTPELVERFIRLKDACDEGRLDEQWDIEFPK